MKKISVKILSVLMALIMTAGFFTCAFAQDKSVFDDGAYASVVTASDFQGTGSQAYDYFHSLLTMAKNDGLTTPDGFLMGGDFTKILFDNAIPGIGRIRHNYLELYPDADPRSIICIQGNHDNPKAELTDTGFYDMGSFCAYAINEDDFPWKQASKKADGVKALAKNIDEKLGAMISAGDFRPVIFVTHVPLHHTDRDNYGDNMYAGYLFDVINEKAKQLDIIFTFGHNHSNDYDDYIGGAVNFLAPGETIRVPLKDKRGKECYTEETLNFTYTNCGYVGYSGNGDTETSTSALTMDVIRFTENSIRFVRYGKDGVFSVEEVERINKNTATGTANYPSLDDTCPCHEEGMSLKKFFWSIGMFFCRLFGIESYCVCGEAHC